MNSAQRGIHTSANCSLSETAILLRNREETVRVTGLSKAPLITQQDQTGTKRLEAYSTWTAGLPILTLYICSCALCQLPGYGYCTKVSLTSILRPTHTCWIISVASLHRLHLGFHFLSSCVKSLFFCWLLAQLFAATVICPDIPLLQFGGDTC